MSELNQGGESLLSQAERNRMIREQKAKELRRRQETKELSEEAVGLEDIYRLQDMGLPLTRRGVGNQAIILSHEEFEQLGFLDVVLPTGETTTILPDADAAADQPIIFFPEDLGDPIEE